MKFIVNFLLVFTLVVLAANICVFADTVGATNEEVEAIANPLLDNILDGLDSGNYVKYTRDFDILLKESITESRFKEIRDQIKKQMGGYLYREYFGFLNRQKMTAVLWKGVFDKAQDDILIKMTVSQRSNKYFITGLWFQ